MLDFGYFTASRCCTTAGAVGGADQALQTMPSLSQVTQACTTQTQPVEENQI